MNNASSTSSVRRNRNRMRRFVFTLNNPTDSEIMSISGAPVSFLTYGREHFNAAPGLTPHLQGCCILGQQMAFSTIKKIPGFERMHIEAMKGTIEQAVAYCHKEDTSPYIFGDLPTPGKRNDILNTVQKLKEGCTIKQMVEEDDDAAVVFVKYHRGLTALQAQLTTSRTEPPVVVWISGATGVGKTRCCIEFCEERSLRFWISNESLQWCDGYSGQEVAILDDYRTSFCKFAYLLRLLDRYPMRVAIKGGFANWIPKYIFVTTPKPLRDTWNLRTSEDLDQLDRRVSLSIIATDYETTRNRLRTFVDGSDLDGGHVGQLGDAELVVIDDSDSDADDEEPFLENKEDSFEDEYYFSLDK